MRSWNRVTRPPVGFGVAMALLLVLVWAVGRGGLPVRRSSSAAPVAPTDVALKSQREATDTAANAASRSTAGAPPQGAGGAGSGAPLPAVPAAPGQLGPLPSLDRMIVKTGVLSLQLGGASAPSDALASAMQRVNAVVAGIPGAYVAASSTTFRAEALEPAVARPEPMPAPKPFPAPGGLNATITLKVPVDAFDQAMLRLRDLGSPLNEQVSTQEVTEEYVDIEAQVRTLEATEQQYLRLMERAQRIDEILPIQQRLNEVRSQIERLRGRMTLLQRRSDVSTITLTLVVPAAKDGQSPVGEPRAVRTLRAAWSQLAVVLQALLDVLIYAGIYTLPLAPLALAYVWWRRRQPGASAAGGVV